jgi:hypothetical protein
MEKKSVTAVEWLEEQMDKNTWYDENGNAQVNIHYVDLCKAKEMEKEQIIEAYCQGDDNVGAEQYYNETFKKD